jgi:16S rRNA (guanine966-N2)-methyltransferase
VKKSSSAGKVRVTAGTAGGLWLKVPKDFNSRPTQDRVKQAIFSSLGSRIPGCSLLDLYAGTGSLGIEALSRGAGNAVFVEKDRNHANVIQENLAYCKLQGQIVNRSVETYLEQRDPALFDLILSDPPYTKGIHNLSNDPVIVSLSRHIKPEGLLVWEHDHRNRWENNPHWSLVKTVCYGESAVSYLKPSDPLP